MTTYHCQKCGKEGFPGFVLSNAGKMAAQCQNPECLFEDASVGPSDFNRGIVAEGTGTGPGWGGKTVRQVETKVQPKAPAPRVPVTAPTAPTDVIGMIDDRALWLGAEEARLSGVIAQAQAQLAGVRAEGKSLQRMLRAARRATPVEPERVLRVVGD